MKMPVPVRTLMAIVSIAGVCLLHVACGGKKAPATTATPVKPAAAAPAIRAKAPAPASPTTGTAAPAAAPRPPAPAPLVGHVTRVAVEDYESWKTLRAQD